MSARISCPVNPVADAAFPQVSASAIHPPVVTAVFLGSARGLTVVGDSGAETAGSSVAGAGAGVTLTGACWNLGSSLGLVYSE